jgi:hypothetical protein
MVYLKSIDAIGFKSFADQTNVFEPRNDLADCSPNTHLIASVILLLPLPFGPTIAVTPLSN